jgi:hypothetical protein
MVLFSHLLILTSYYIFSILLAKYPFPLPFIVSATSLFQPFLFLFWIHQFSLSVDDTIQGPPQWMPDAMNITKPFIYYVFYKYTYDKAQYLSQAHEEINSNNY